MSARWIVRVVITTIIALVSLFAILWLRLINSSSPIPSNVQMQASFDREQAAGLYSKAHKDLWCLYWHGVHSDIRALQLKSAWDHIVNGPGAIQGVVADVNSNVVCCVKYANGQTFWITVLPR